MSTRRTARVASMIREVVSSAILTELRDPRIRNVTVLGAEISPDLRHASVRVSVMGDEKTASLSMHGLNSARGYLQSRVGAYIKSRYTPEIRFVLDEGVRKSVETAALLREVLESSSSSEQPSDDSDDLPEDLAGIDIDEWEDDEDDEEGKTDA